MSFGLGRGRTLDPGVGRVGVGPDELGPLPDEAATDARAGRVDPRQWFEHPDRPLEIEIGSGKGTFLLAHGAEHPGTNLLGIEWAKEFYAYAADRVRRAGLPNVRMLHADATEFLHWRCPDGVARVIHLYFPDPWPKSRHHKRRTVQDRFLADAWRVLEPGGALRIVTDHDEYWEWMEAHFARWCAPSEARAQARAPEANGEVSARDASPGSRPGLRFIREPFERAPSSTEGELVGTNFERKYRREGRPFHAVVLRKPD